ncbi:hypothetical protein DAPPUDRAFT_107237 [Daphnia pulex]|uniref:Uncharacterized protein n=1 Tax=Daphnia pulex TaxID=6669 RepID=E9GWF7_DAPPU|nr:hypothetical protein DAPPUDRAFT_107237 [Daphnia pulex]|eukprot:EFX76093.1 hypothetical protein DAPPUDRAFT_107237 [Daphnia pulex]
MVDRRRCCSVTEIVTASIGRSLTLFTGPLLNSGAGKLVPKDEEKSKIVLKNRSIKWNQTGNSESRHDVIRVVEHPRSCIIVEVYFQCAEDTSVWRRTFVGTMRYGIVCVIMCGEALPVVKETGERQRRREEREQITTEQYLGNKAAGAGACVILQVSLSNNELWNFISCWSFISSFNVRVGLVRQTCGRRRYFIYC